MAQWRIEMLGGLLLRDNTGGQAVQTKFYSRKAALLLARLALPPMRVYGREELIELLWPESALTGGRANLRNVLAHLRRQLASDAPDGAQALGADNTHIWLNPEAVETDVAAFEGLLKRARRASGEGESEEALRAALALYRGELMPGYYADWLYLERERLGALHNEAMRTLRDLAERRKDTDEARDLTFRLARTDGEDEPDTAKQSFVLSSPFLPALYTRFFGREREARELLALLNSSRLVTLTGMGGVGKTRLAQETAADFARLTQSSAAFVPLEPARQAGHVIERIFASLALSPPDQADPVAQAAKELEERNVWLLVLDNFEHLLTTDGAARSGVSDLLKKAARLHILITSRQPLNLPGECVYALTPLDTPAPGTPLEADALMQVASIQLFADRARLARPDFAVTARNAHAVAAICRQLEGIPLSLEIAAARMLVTTPWQMQAELEQRLSFLTRRTTHGQSAPSARHQSLRSTLEWSHGLLSPPLVRCFAAFAAFRGGLTPEAAREVCEDEDVLGHIEELCQVSLLCPEERGEAMRFCFLDTVREFAREKLTADGEENAIRARHFALFLRMADQADEALTGPDQQQWLDRLEADHDNMRAALDWALAQSNPANALELSFMLWRFWQTRGHLREGREWLRKALAKAGEGRDNDEKRLRARVQNALGALAIHASHFEEARTASVASIALFEECSPFDVIGPLNNLGLIHLYLSEYEQAIQAFTPLPGHCQPERRYAE